MHACVQVDPVDPCLSCLHPPEMRRSKKKEGAHPAPRVVTTTEEEPTEKTDELKVLLAKGELSPEETKRVRILMTQANSAPRDCSSCGNTLMVDAKFCRNCGKPAQPSGDEQRAHDDEDNDDLNDPDARLRHAGHAVGRAALAMRAMRKSFVALAEEQEAEKLVIITVMARIHEVDVVKKMQIDERMNIKALIPVAARKLRVPAPAYPLKLHIYAVTDHDGEETKRLLTDHDKPSRLQEMNTLDWLLLSEQDDLLDS